MELRVHISNVENNSAICFDTGLDPRSFARTKMSQSLIEPGYVVKADGSHDVWKASGVNENDGFMRVYGPLFQGKRLDLLLDEISSQTLGNKEALGAVISWIKAKMFLGETKSALNPGASFYSPDGSVFFAPEYLSTRCLYLEGVLQDRYNCPDLAGMEATAFCAGLMLYKIFTGVHPYPSSEIYQDMREGVFMPINFAYPGLNEKLAKLIQSALLLPVDKKQLSRKNKLLRSGIDILTGILEVLSSEEPVITSLSKEKTDQTEKDKKIFLIKQYITVRSARFAVRNKYLLVGVSIGVLFLLFVAFSTAKSFSSRLTTAGLSPETVVTVYYDAFSSLNHDLMEACILGASRTDVNAALSIFAIYKQRQAYEMSTRTSIKQAKIWKENGNELPAPDVFGVTDLTVEKIGGDESEGLVLYRADYELWSPMEDFSRSRSDRLMLKTDKRKNWRIVEIERTER